MDPLILANLQNGAVIERVNWELQKIARNIADPNTDPKKARTLTLKLKIVPDDTREVSDIEISVSSAIAPMKPLRTRMYMDEDGEGGFQMQELVKNQMPGQITVDETAANVRQLKGAK